MVSLMHVLTMNVKIFARRAIGTMSAEKIRLCIQVNRTCGIAVLVAWILFSWWLDSYLVIERQRTCPDPCPKWGPWLVSLYGLAVGIGMGVFTGAMPLPLQSIDDTVHKIYWLLLAIGVIFVPSTGFFLYQWMDSWPLIEPCFRLCAYITNLLVGTFTCGAAWTILFTYQLTRRLRSLSRIPANP